jgi:hypothetical protein
MIQTTLGRFSTDGAENEKTATRGTAYKSCISGELGFIREVSALIRRLRVRTRIHGVTGF